jgi:polysaccharide pyruvyl transferase WcaK-like protein
MERLDARACTEFAAHLGGVSVPVFTSEDYDIFQLVSILRQSSLMVSSRYHGIVSTMPAMVASAGVTMDERIRNLMNERGHQHLFLTVDDPDLEPKLLNMMETLVAEADSVRDGVARTAVRNLKVMARMGKFLQEAVQRTYPEFPLRSGVFSWEEYLPPLSKNLIQLAERYDSSPAALAAVR